MDPFSVALIIGLGGSFLTVWLVNLIGGRLEVKVQQLSHQWMQWPQRAAMFLGVLTCAGLAINYYYWKTYGTDIFDLFKDLPLLRELVKPLRWFFNQLGNEFALLFTVLPQQMPLLTMVIILLIALIILSLFGVKGVQRWIFILILGIMLLFLLQSGFRKAKPNDRNLFAPNISTDQPSWDFQEDIQDGG